VEGCDVVYGIVLTRGCEVVYVEGLGDDKRYRLILLPSRRKGTQIERYTAETKPINDNQEGYKRRRGK
jgi:hypothetical protein